MAQAIYCKVLIFKKKGDLKIHICGPPGLGFVIYNCVCLVKNQNISSSFLRNS